MSKDSLHLQALQDQNKKRNETLFKLAATAAAAAAAEEIHNANTNENNETSTHHPPFSIFDKLDAVQVEIKEISRQDTRNDFPSCLEPETFVSPSNATEQRALLDAWGEEIVATHEDLRQTNAVLEVLLQREEQKLQRKRDFDKEQKHWNKALQEELGRMRQQQQQQQQQESGRNNDFLTTNSNKNQCIRQQLAHVAKKLTSHQTTSMEATSAEESSTTKKKRKISSSASSTMKVTKKRQKNSNEQPPLSLTSPPPARDSRWTLDRIVLDLMNRLLDHPSDPYLFLGQQQSAGIINNNRDDNQIHDDTATAEEEKMIQLLRECHVVECHPDNERLIRLTDYRR